ncbi:hypothetical protein [Bradyrhizobium sp.]|jgi:hypothetical protein|uniref:hypothetical protein n=1 Tax=Bradyrhizobium sp. TaxID=376 RepID=UPI002CDD7B5F|nr:hypothetical protein [Bradyrhizobium sp.]HWX56982.1 hypothetical protein [Bradyrhizobium sp.]
MEALKPIWTVARSANSADGGGRVRLRSKGVDGPGREDEGRARAEAAKPTMHGCRISFRNWGADNKEHNYIGIRGNEVPVSGLILCSVALEVSMPRTGWMPSMVPYGADQTVYLVVDSFRSQGSGYRESEIERTNIETIIADFMSGQFNDPIRVVAFNTLEHWTEDVSEEVANEIRIRCDIEGISVPEHIVDFVVCHTGRLRQPGFALCDASTGSSAVRHRAAV